MSMVHASRGVLKPASERLRSEPAIVAGIAQATLPDTKVDWAGLVADYALIRDKIEAVFPDFYDFNQRVAVPGGFRLDVPASRREWRTASGKANFLICDGVEEDPRVGGADVLRLATIRSHDQYNTTIYGFDDRYRGIAGRRDVVFVNPLDLQRLGLAHGDRVDVRTVAGADEPERVLRGQTVVAYDIAPGSVAAYYPEANGLLALDQFDVRSGTPAYKSIPVRLRAAS